MKCPKCNQEGGCRYVEKRKKTGSSNRPENQRFKEPRTNFQAVCKNCGWKGEIK